MTTAEIKNARLPSDLPWHGQRHFAITTGQRSGYVRVSPKGARAMLKCRTNHGWSCFSKQITHVLPLVAGGGGSLTSTGLRINPKLGTYTL